MTGVMGFLAQCEMCPQRALLTDQLDTWICPRCTNFEATADRDDVDRVIVVLPDGTRREGIWDRAAGCVRPAAPDPLPRALQIIGDFLEVLEAVTDDDDYPVGRVQG